MSSSSSSATRAVPHATQTFPRGSIARYNSAVSKIRTGLDQVNASGALFLEGRQTVEENGLWHLGGFTSLEQFDEVVCSGRAQDVGRFMLISEQVWIAWQRQSVCSLTPVVGLLLIFQSLFPTRTGVAGQISWSNSNIPLMVYLLLPTYVPGKRSPVFNEPRNAIHTSSLTFFALPTNFPATGSVNLNQAHRGESVVTGPTPLLQLMSSRLSSNLLFLGSKLLVLGSSVVALVAVNLRGFPRQMWCSRAMLVRWTLW